MTAPDDPSPAPDVTRSVMTKLGYLPEADAAPRRSAIAIRIGQLALILAACALGIAWWGARSRALRTQPAVGDAMRGSVVQGAGRLDALRLGMPRRAEAAPAIAADPDASAGASGDRGPAQ